MSNGNITLSYTPGGADDPKNPFHYMPSLGAAVASLIIYMLLFIVLTTLTIWKKCWYMIPLLIGCIMEVIGYGTRIPLCINPIGRIALYANMHACLIIAPVFNAAIEYVLFGRLMHAVGDHYSLIKPRLVAWIFIICDIISFIIQVAGAGILTSSTTSLETAKTGENVLLAGLAVNLASFAIFCLQIFYFDYRTRKLPPELQIDSVYQKLWRKFLYVIYLSSFLVLIRQIYRVIEFAQGFTGYLAVHEVYFYIFDTIPIFVSGAIYTIFFPGNGYLPPNRNETIPTIHDNIQNLVNMNNNKNNVVLPQKSFNFDEKC